MSKRKARNINALHNALHERLLYTMNLRFIIFAALPCHAGLQIDLDVQILYI